MPLLAAGTGPAVVAQPGGACSMPGGLLVAGFGLDAAHLPIPEPTVDLVELRRVVLRAPGSSSSSALRHLGRRAVRPGGGYAVSVHRAAPD